MIFKFNWRYQVNSDWIFLINKKAPLVWSLPLSRTLKKSQLISRPLPAKAGLIIQSDGQVLNTEVRWEINTVLAELTMLFFGDSFFFQTPLSNHQDVIFFFSLREKKQIDALLQLQLSEVKFEMNAIPKSPPI